MIVHEPVDNLCSTNQLLHYSSPKTSEDAHEFIVALQQFLLDELKNSEKNPGGIIQVILAMMKFMTTIFTFQ